jgi:hypothetical protein
MRLGENIWIRGEFDHDTPSGNAQFTLPTGLTCDTGTMTGPILVGELQQDAVDDRQFFITATDGDSVLKIGHSDVSTATNHIAQTTWSAISASGTRLVVNCMVKITEYVGSGTMNVLQEDNLTEWTSYTPTFEQLDWTNTNFYWKREGSNMRVVGFSEVSGLTGQDSAVLQISLPSGYTLDTSVIPTGSDYKGLFGAGVWDDAGVPKSVSPYFIDSSNFGLFKAIGVGTTGLRGSDLAAADNISFNMTVPILEWANVNQNSLVGFSQYDGTNAGLMVNPTALSDAAAASMGLKRYTQADETISESLDSGTVNYAELIPYQMSDGTWRLKFNIGDDNTLTNATVTLTFSNTTFANVTGAGGAGQACSAHADSGSVYLITGKVADNGSTITLTFSGTYARYCCSGDVALASKPSWVD